MSRSDDLRRIREALRAAAEAIRPYTPGDVAWERKEDRGDPVTAADHAADAVLREVLPAAGEGWLSEESVDDAVRLRCERVWVVDPIDGTREFIDGIPEWCVSIGLLEDGEPVAGGILNPATGESVIGAAGSGVVYEGPEGGALDVGEGESLLVLASRSEIRRGEWRGFQGRFRVKPCGSVAYKLGLVAAGLADATWTLVPKSEWDVAGGAALVLAAGGAVTLADGRPPRFNQRNPTLPDFVAVGPGGAGSDGPRDASAMLERLLIDLRERTP
jgi:myo-inositol-1(or 4)-monophosphatase